VAGGRGTAVAAARPQALRSCSLAAGGAPVLFRLRLPVVAAPWLADGAPPQPKNAKPAPLSEWRPPSAFGADARAALLRSRFPLLLLRLPFSPSPYV